MISDLDKYLFGRHKVSVKQISDTKHNYLLGGKKKNIVVYQYKISDFFSVNREKIEKENYKEDFFTFILFLKQTLLGLGFTEVKHRTKTTQYWNYDFLEIPKDHPDRDLINSFHFKTKEKNSKSEISLATHTTASIFRYYSEKNEKFKNNKKNFILGTVFRRETEDLTHFIEFNQLEFNIFGNYTITDFKKFIESFFNNLNISIFFKRSIYPYTEPSFDICTIYNNKELELGGLGMFRQKIKIKIGCRVNMYGVGIGVERLFLVKNNLNRLSEINEV